MKKGFSLVELLMVVAIIAVLVAIITPLMRAALLRAHVGAMAGDAKSIQLAFKRYFIDYHMYPNADSAPKFNLATFDPLVEEGYYDARIVPKLLGDEADGYDSPDDMGQNQEFWLELTLKYEPSIRFLVADSDDAPLSGGEFMDGIYLYRDGELRSLKTPIE